MTLTNYWWLLIWLALAGAAFSYFYQKERVSVLGKIEYRWRWAPALILAAPYILWAMNRSCVGDTEVYRATFLEAPSSLGQLSAYLEDAAKDKGFSVLTVVLKLLIGNNDKLFFLIIATFQMFCIVYFFRKYSTDYLLCMFMFIASTDYLSWMFNGMRQFIAVCIVLFSFDFVLKKQMLPAIALVIAASGIHGSALLMIPLLFIIQGKAFNKKTWLMMIVVIVAVLYMDQFTTILDDMLSDTQYSDMVTNEIWTNDDGTNMLRVLFYSIPFILALFGKPYINEANSPVLNLCVNCAACTSILYVLSAFSSGIYVGRLPIYTTLPGYAMIPWLLDHMFTKTSGKVIRSGLIGGFLLFFYYQMHMTWGYI